MPNQPSEAVVIRTPAEITLNLSSQCNLRCRYCSFFDSANAVPAELPTAEWLRFIREAGSLGVMKLHFGGAEPFKRPDLPELLSETKACRMRFGLISNGALITPELARFIAGLGRCDRVQISFDGPAAQHDLARGRGAHDGALSGIRHLKAAGIKVVSRITIGRHNLGHLAETVRFLLDDLQIDAVSTNSVTMLNSMTKPLDGLALSIDEYAESMREHQALPAAHRAKLSATCGPLNSLTAWRRLDDARRENHPPVRRYRCLKIFSTLAVRADGVALPCSQWSEIELGRINQTPLLEIWRHNLQFNELRLKVSPESAAPAGKCVGCPYWLWCGGPCPAMEREGNICYQDFILGGGHFEWHD